MVDNGKIIEALSNLHIDTTNLSDEVVNKEVVRFYLNRLFMCVEDGCLGAASAYLEMMQRDSTINASTKLEILHDYQKLVLKED